MDNKTKADRIFDLLPKFLDARNDENWSSVVEAIGSEDDRLAQLAEDVRNQFFVKTASRPYLDRLAANVGLSRPRFVGMSDTDFRKFIPILSYQPKQVKRIIDELLDLFFFKEATTAFLSTATHEPFALKDGWNLELFVDNQSVENVIFHASEFGDITNATADEVAAAYNRQAKYSYAVSYFDSVTKFTFVRFFTNAIGAQGSLIVTGGLACIGFEPNGFLFDLGSGNNTQWVITKVGNTVTFAYNGGIEPGVEFLQPGDVFLCDLPGNQGSFSVLTVDVQDRSFTFENLLATPGTITQTNSQQTKWLRPVQVNPYTVPRRALVWETDINVTTIEMPATPPIVARGAKGGFHINGSFGVVTQINSSSSLTVSDASDFPNSGFFIIEPVETITARLTGGAAEKIVTYNSQGRVIYDFVRYSYTGRSGNTLTGITPSLPSLAGLEELNMVNLVRASDQLIATVPNTFAVGERVFITGSSGVPILTTAVGNTSSGSATLTSVTDVTGVAPGQLILGVGIPAGTHVLHVSGPSTVTMTNTASASASSVHLSFNEDTNGSFEIIAADPTGFTVGQVGTDGVVAVPGIVSNERAVLADNGFKIIVTTSESSDITKIKGPYVWDLNAPFVLAADTSTSTNPIVAGKTVKLLTLDTTNLPDGEGHIVIDYGQNNQEGPIKYLYKAAPNILALDPSYVFQRNHTAGASVVAVSKLGPHKPDGDGNEYPPYATNPPDARKLLQDLIVSVASAGIFIDFIIRFPNQLYGTLNVYN